MNLSMLLVEDDAHGREVVRALLTHYEVAVDVAETAETALNFLREHPYNAVIIDLSLPGMSGWELLKRIQQNPATAALPCFAITAYHSSIV
ncbi:MAG: response regulator, partial [Anaerolineae bacterium]|nr:response regulator [Anaerolineae bacterium]